MLCMRLLSLLLAAAVTFVPATGLAQQQRNRLAIGIGIGRLVPLQPVATAAGHTVQYKLDDASATVLSLDYWFKPWLATRVSYQWLTTDLAEPDQPSFARIRSGYLGLVLAPVQIGLRARPYAVLGAGLRRYDVNSILIDSTVAGPNSAWDIAPTQNRVAGYGGVGSNLRIGRAELVPEAGIFFNQFRHNFPCNGCSGQRDSQIDALLSIRFQLR